ncbi:MAG TPA: phosphate ABC transporter permease PtsA [Alphaproteobacteria bacterium]|nr:phosphate ABC transporter permease PtsA [Alphaproteobacteria bacterium]
MTDISAHPELGAKRQKEAKLVKSRYGSDRRFQAYGIICIGIAMLALVTLLISIIGAGYSAFHRHTMKLDINLAAAGVTVENAAQADIRVVVRDAIREMFPSATSRRDRRELGDLVSPSAYLNLRQALQDNPELAAQGQITIDAPMGATAELFLKGQATDVVDHAVSEPLNIAISDSDEGMKPVQITAAGRLLTEVRQGSRNYLENAVRKQERQEARLADVLEGLEDEQSRQAISQKLEQIRSKLADAKERLANINDRIVLDADMPSFLISAGEYQIKLTEASTAGAEGIITVAGQKVLAGNSQIDEWSMTELATPENSRKVSDNTIMRVMALERLGMVSSEFNLAFFETADSRDPEVAGIWGSLKGSFFTMIITLVLSFPVAVAAAVYLEEFAPKNRVTDLIEVNINNLAAVPSIVFGLLGLAVFLNTFGLPRSAPLVGGMVLALMTLPTIIIASRAALKAVPPSIREGAVGVGASKMQAVFDHVLPLAMPGMLTGTIIGMAQALGETAPLLLIGMNAFIADAPAGFTSPAAVLPVQIYIWADAPERGFVEKTSAAIMVLLTFLVLMNGLAIFLRKKFERRW